MVIDLTEHERFLAIQGCRSLAYRAALDAVKQDSLQIRARLMEHSRQLRELADKLEKG